MFVGVVTMMDQREWLTCHTSAFEFFGGAPRRIVPDNLKSGIIKPDLYDPNFNQGYEELAHHYWVIIDRQGAANKGTRHGWSGLYPTSETASGQEGIL
jgi:transposase